MISAFEKGGQWRHALATYEAMRAQRCRPDAIVYNAIIDTLWETGVIWAQRKARLRAHAPTSMQAANTCHRLLSSCAENITAQACAGMLHPARLGPEHAGLCGATPYPHIRHVASWVAFSRYGHGLHAERRVV